MALMDVDRALERPGEYYLEDGLFEIVMGLWIGLTVALPLVLGGVAADWATVLMVATGLAVRPAVRAAKDRWVHPRTGHVAYPELAGAPTQASLGLSPASGPAVSPVRRSWAAVLWPMLIGGGCAAFIGAGFPLSRRLGYGDAGGHLTIGVLLASSLLYSAWRWRQRRWIVLALALMLLAIGVPASGLATDAALAVHVAGIAAAVLVSGAFAFARYLGRAQDTPGNADGP